MKKINLRSALTIILLLALLSPLSGLSPVLAQSDAPVGKVLAVRGDVQARASDGSLRALMRKSDIFVSDTILVGANGQAQVRMVDDAQFAFKSNTEFAFNS